MKLIDSHCHLHLIDYEQLNSDMATVVKAAQTKGVTHMLCVATDFSEHEQLCAISEQFDSVSISTGLHPNESMTVKPDLQILSALASHPKVIAIGETGLDYYRDPSAQHRITQQAWFTAHIAVANKLNKPLIVHTRMAKADTIAILKAENASNAGVVLHCFTEDWEMASQALDLGCYISFSGIITFKNADSLREIVKKMPMDRLLIETDSPFLAPVPFRGKINQPSYVTEVAQSVALLKNMSMESIANKTSENFQKLFKLNIEGV
jgi:TatD DNase family protein